MKRLEDFVHAFGSEMQLGQALTRQQWPGIHIASMEVVLAATVETDAAGELALRIGRSPRRRETLHELRIAVPGSADDAITVLLDGQLLGRYKSKCHD